MKVKMLRLRWKRGTVLKICCPSLLMIISPERSFLMSFDLPKGPKEVNKALALSWTYQMEASNSL